MVRWILVLATLALTGCAARRHAADEVVDPRLAEADRLWEARSQRGLEPVDRAVTAGLRKPGASDVPWLWRHARLLVERGTTEEATPRVALDSYATARSQALDCLESLPGWQARRTSYGLESALELVDPAREPCVAWGAVAWARWVALFGADAAALDLPEIRLLAQRAAAGPEADLGRRAQEILRDAVARAETAAPTE